MTINEIRARYLAFMEKRGHALVPSASLVPEGDATTLFTTAGMQPMMPYLLGQNTLLVPVSPTLKNVSVPKISMKWVTIDILLFSKCSQLVLG